MFPGLPKVHNQFFGLCHFELQMILLAPLNKEVNHSLVLHLITLADASNQSRVIRKRLKVADVCAVAEVHGVEGEEERGEDGPLWWTRVADHLFRLSILKTHILWSSCQIINNPGHKKGIHLHRCQLITQEG